jgi:hypothetical protein
MRLHDLRHGAASLLIASGADLRTVMGVLGHSQVRLTADTMATSCRRCLPTPRAHGRAPGFRCGRPKVPGPDVLDRASARGLAGDQRATDMKGADPSRFPRQRHTRREVGPQRHGADPSQPGYPQWSSLRWRSWMIRTGLSGFRPSLSPCSSGSSTYGETGRQAATRRGLARSTDCCLVLLSRNTRSPLQEAQRGEFTRNRWSRRWDSNPRPTVYETVALPLSYFGPRRRPDSTSHPITAQPARA